ncbi:unnamed protein product [Prorocentrum cordatum]|uniref:Uncharacterized protein n=1 Tax=Prorocentrum cordatum TaxID=2364126 RepID=A0ABN9X2R5_9DINO|nr:unnamed protein product [Polarella glacialis]
MLWGASDMNAVEVIAVFNNSSLTGMSGTLGEGHSELPAPFALVAAAELAARRWGSVALEPSVRLIGPVKNAQYSHPKIAIKQQSAPLKGGPESVDIRSLAHSLGATGLDRSARGEGGQGLPRAAWARIDRARRVGADAGAANAPANDPAPASRAAATSTRHPASGSPIPALSHEMAEAVAAALESRARGRRTARPSGDGRSWATAGHVPEMAGGGGAAASGPDPLDQAPEIGTAEAWSTDFLTREKVHVADHCIKVDVKFSTRLFPRLLQLPSSVGAVCEKLRLVHQQYLPEVLAQDRYQGRVFVVGDSGSGKTLLTRQLFSEVAQQQLLGIRNQPDRYGRFLRHLQAECVNAHMQVHGLDFATFPCPECRTTERQLQSMEAARLQRQQVVSSSGSSAAAGHRRAAVFRIPLTQGGERRITRENRRSRSPPPRVVADSPIMQPESPGGAIVPAASPTGTAVVPAASPIGRGLSQSISPSQSQPSRPQGPATTDADFGFTFTDNTAAGGDGAPVPDPSLAAIRALDAVPNAAAFRTALHPTGLFNGLQDERGARETAKQWLGEMLADPRDHKEVGMDPSFSIRLLLPRPFRTAVVAVASREGWQLEALMKGIMSNAGRLEHHATVLEETADETRSRKPTIAIFGAAMPSTRKTSLARFVSVSLLDDTDEGRQLQACTCGDATLRGLLNCISTHERSGLVNDEITTAYDTTFSQGSRGCHYAGKPTMLKFVNGERSITLCWGVRGQIPAVEEVLQRDSIGFRKRFNTIWFGEAAGHPTQNTEQSTILLTAFMSWMCQNALPHSRKCVNASLVSRQLPIDMLAGNLIPADPRCRGVVTSGDALTWVRARLMARGERDVAGRVHGAIQAAAAAGVVEIIAGAPAAEDGADAAPRARRGRRVLRFRKNPWATVLANEVASAFAVSLQLNADSFED